MDPGSEAGVTDECERLPAHFVRPVTPNARTAPACPSTKEQTTKEVVMFPFKARLMASAFILAASSGAAFAAADLVPDASNLATIGQAAVTNMGDEATEPSQLIVTCQKTSGGMGGCAEDPGMAAYEDAAYPNAAVINVPALEPGESFEHALPFWGSLVWAAGTYELTLTADAGEVIPEDDETNNEATVEKQQLAKNNKSPVPIGPGTLTLEPHSGGGLPFKLQFTFGQ